MFWWHPQNVLLLSGESHQGTQACFAITGMLNWGNWNVNCSCLHFFLVIVLVLAIVRSMTFSRAVTTGVLVRQPFCGLFSLGNKLPPHRRRQCWVKESGVRVWLGRQGLFSKLKIVKCCLEQRKQQSAWIVFACCLKCSVGLDSRDWIFSFHWMAVSVTRGRMPSTERCFTYLLLVCYLYF